MYRKLCVVLLLFATCCNSEVTVENGGYSVLITFSRNVPHKDGNTLLNNMKESLKEASEVLKNAIGLGFSKVTVEIPNSWDTSEWNITVEQSFEASTSKADFLIDNTNDVVFGKLPFAQQYGGCGIPGRQITIPTAFFDEASTFPKGISLAREWLKYRYGVFDENGYFGDTLYPLYYTTPGSDPNEVKITDCTNEKVTYNFLDQEGENCSTSDKTLTERLNSRECAIKPEENADVTSSMMYFQEDIQTLLHICGKDSDQNHNSKALNKQNTLCSSRSIWEVVQDSKDFKEDTQREADTEGHDDIQYIYVQEAKPKIVVGWENTKQMKAKGPVIFSAIKQLVIDLPSGSKFSAFPFTSNAPAASKIYDLVELNGMGDKKQIIDTISSDLVASETGNINIAISTALDIFSKEDSEAGGTIIIITKNNETAEEAVLERLTELKLCIMFLLINDDTPGDPTAEIKRYGTASDCLTVENIMTNKDEDTYNEVLEIMKTLLPPAEDDKETETAKIEYLSDNSPISLHVDDLVENVAFSVFSKKESENFQLTFNEEKIEDPFKEELIGDVLILSYSPTQGGDITFAFPHETAPMLTHVRVTSKEGKYFNGEIVVHDTSGEGEEQMPVIIYAIIRFGAYPVQNAKVSATVEDPNNEAFTFELKDNGRGNPDITQNDGIYSRYFTRFSGEGRYTVTVTVKDNEGHTTFGADENTGYKSCCGSSVNDNTPKLTEFTKVLKTTFTARGGRPDSGYEPSRILDLRIDNVVDDKITLKWTAPGEEADSGTAQLYEIKCFASQDEAMNKFDDGKAVLNYTVPPKESGEIENFEIDLKDFEGSGLYYIVIKTTNNNEKSAVSNIIEVFIPEKTTDAPDGDDKSIEDVKKGGVNTKIVGIIIGVIVALIVLVILIYVAIYFVVVKPKRKKENKKKQEMQGPVRIDNTALNPINFVSASTLIEHHNEKAKAKLENKEPPIFKEEDFEDRNSLPTNESGESAHNDQQLENKNRMTKEDEPKPPKSPKRTTLV